MLWRKVIIAAVGAAVFSATGLYYLVNQRISALEQQVLPIKPLPEKLQHIHAELQKLRETAFPEQPASVKDVKQLEEKYALNTAKLQQELANLTASLKKAREQLEKLVKIPIPADPASIDYVNTLVKENKKNFLSALQTNAEQDSKIDRKVDDIQQAITGLLNIIKLKEDSLNRLIPPGTVIAYAGPTDAQARQFFHQIGWLICDGSELTTENYPELYQVIRTVYGGNPPDSFKLPDFRGVFLRGLDLDRQLDQGRTLGSYQEDSNKAHIHEGKAMGGVHEHQGDSESAGEHKHQLEARGYWFTTKNLNERRAITEEVNDNQKYWTDIAGQHAHHFKIPPSGAHEHGLTIESAGSSESRPKNYPVTYLIKF